MRLCVCVCLSNDMQAEYIVFEATTLTRLDKDKVKRRRQVIKVDDEYSAMQTHTHTQTLEKVQIHKYLTPRN